jgi:hypothetical protein
MMQNKILEKLKRNERDFKIITKIFGSEQTNDGIKTGLSTAEIIKIMRKASKEKLFIEKKDAAYSR